MMGCQKKTNQGQQDRDATDSSSSRVMLLHLWPGTMQKEAEGQ